MRAFAVRRRGEAGIVGEAAGVAVELADVDRRRADGAGAHRQLRPACCRPSVSALGSVASFAALSCIFMIATFAPEASPMPGVTIAFRRYICRAVGRPWNASAALHKSSRLLKDLTEFLRCGKGSLSIRDRASRRGRAMRPRALVAAQHIHAHRTPAAKRRP